MGKAHTNGWCDVSRFYDLPVRPVLKAACDVNPASEIDFSRRYGWEEFETSWEALISRSDIDIIDICTPNIFHAPIAIAAAKAGKHILCEKPMAMSVNEAKEMRNAAKRAGVVNMVAFNYRRLPAIALAKRMIDEGHLGAINHFNAVYYQDWLVDPAFPFVWRHDKKLAGSGAHGDMNAHTIDLARYLAGEINSVVAQKKVFIPNRKTVDGAFGIVTADDSMSFMVDFESGAIGSFIATRFATGRKNYLRLEIFGSKGALVFNLERLNELEFYSRDDNTGFQGFRTILVTEAEHPYISRWWPPGHIIGWEHTFIHEIGDFLEAVAENKTISPDFQDGYMNQLILDAVSTSAENQQWVDINPE